MADADGLGIHIIKIRKSRRLERYLQAEVEQIIKSTQNNSHSGSIPDLIANLLNTIKMKATVKVEKEVEITHVRVEVAVRYDEEDIPNDFPLRTGDTWKATINIENGQILDWPIGKSGDMHMKVCDEGSYYLLDEHGNEVLSIENDYVPNDLIPGSYGDYIELSIDSNGIITNWPNDPRIDEFYDED